MLAVSCSRRVCCCSASPAGTSSATSLAVPRREKLLRVMDIMLRKVAKPPGSALNATNSSTS